MNRFLAKSEPEETIQEHTDNLLANLELLKSYYPSIKTNWDMIKVACIYHDLGKMNSKFQDKIEKVKKHDDEIAHNLLSIAFINPKELKTKYGFNDDDICIIAEAIAYHHERGDYDAPNYSEEVEVLRKQVESFVYEKVSITRVKKISARYFSNKDRIFSGDKRFYDYVMIKGLLNRLDYAASSGISVELDNDFLLKGLNNFKNENSFEWNSLQQFMSEYTNENVVVVAQTGMGKTEAGLLWLGDNKGFFTLPLKTAINEIYKRITESIVGLENQKKVGLLHSDTYSHYLGNKKKDDDIDEYYNSTKQLCLPLTICTLDQIFDFVFRNRNFELKLATMAYSKIIIDEIQMYSPDLLAYLIIGLYYIQKTGGKFAILTATLPNIILDLLREHKIPFIMPERPFITETIRHRVHVVETQIDCSFILSKFVKKKLLIICNTVSKAQEIFNSLKKSELLIRENTSIQLIHSRFIKSHRKEKEGEIVLFGQKDNVEYGIWVATQVVEASLDLDFDILFTELSDINGLLQRMGRCYRKREFSGKGYNCYVFNGGEKACSGINEGNKSIIDIDIFNFSKSALLQWSSKTQDNFMTEQQKLDLIESVYTSERLKDTAYLKKVRDYIDMIIAKDEYDAKENFRDIHTVTIIPKVIFDTNQKIIEKNVSILKQEYSKDMTKLEIKALKEKKVSARSEILQYTLEIYEYQYKEAPIHNTVYISKYNEIPVVGYEYTYELGLNTQISEQVVNFM